MFTQLYLVYVEENATFFVVCVNFAAVRLVLVVR